MLNDESSCTPQVQVLTFYLSIEEVEFIAAVFLSLLHIPLPLMLVFTNAIEWPLASSYNCGQKWSIISEKKEHTGINKELCFC